MDPKAVRDASVRAAKRLGVNVSRTLPLPDPVSRLRDAEEVLSRILAMHAAAAAAYGLDRIKAISWLNREGLAASLTEDERGFLFEGLGRPAQFQVQIEGMWVLAWSMGIVEALDFTKDCSMSFVTELPNLKHSESSAAFRERANPRRLEDVVAAWDLAYCLHWAIRESKLTNIPPPRGLKPFVIAERRRALEWLVGEEAWDEIALDT